MCLDVVKAGSVGCAADAAVLVAAEERRAARVAPARVELAGARALEVVAVAAAGVPGEASPEDVAGPFVAGEFGAALGNDGVELA